MKLFPTKEKGKPKQQPKARPWALSRVLCRSNNNKKQAMLPPPVPKTVAPRRTTARTKAASSSSSRNKNSTLEARLLTNKNSVTDRNRWVPQVPYDERNHATHNRRTVPTTTTPSCPKTSRMDARPPMMDARPPMMDASRKSFSKQSQGTSSSCTTSLLDDTTLDSFSSAGSTMLDTTTTPNQQVGCEDGNRELSLFLCGKILDHAGLRSPQDSQEEQDAWDELILDLLLA